MRQKRNGNFQADVAVEGIMLVLEGRYKPSKQRAWNSKTPAPLLATPCLWEKAVPSAGLTSLTQNLFVAGSTLAWTMVNASSHRESMKVSVKVLTSICSVSCQSRAIRRPVHTMCPRSLHNKGKDQLICQDCMLLISMCGRSNLYGKERFVSLVRV